MRRYMGLGKRKQNMGSTWGDGKMGRKGSGSVQNFSKSFSFEMKSRPLAYIWLRLVVFLAMEGIHSLFRSEELEIPILSSIATNIPWLKLIVSNFRLKAFPSSTNWHWQLCHLNTNTLPKLKWIKTKEWFLISWFWVV